MRFALLMGFLVISGCTGEKLAVSPPPGVDLSGKWRLNEADSDDPLRLAMSQSVGSTVGAAGTSSSPGGQGGRGAGRGGGAAGGYAGPIGPSMPAVGVLNDGLRWPGKSLEVTQTTGVVAISSMGTKQVYRPAAGTPSPRRNKSDDEGAHGRRLRGDARSDGPPPICGWDDKTLVIESENPDEDNPPFEQRYSLSSDGQRLVEVVAFKGGRSQGFVVSRVWDRAPPENGDGSSTNLKP